MNDHCDLEQLDNFDGILSAKAFLRKRFEEGMFIRTLPTTLLQILREIILNSLVIVKSIIDLDDNFWVIPELPDVVQLGVESHISPAS